MQLERGEVFSSSSIGPVGHDVLETEPPPEMAVILWSGALGKLIYLVPERGKVFVPPGAMEVTHADIQRIQELEADGWDRPTAIYRTLGIRPVVSHG